MINSPSVDQFDSSPPLSLTMAQPSRQPSRQSVATTVKLNVQFQIIQTAFNSTIVMANNLEIAMYVDGDPDSVKVLKPLRINETYLSCVIKLKDRLQGGVFYRKMPDMILCPKKNKYGRWVCIHVCVMNQYLSGELSSSKIKNT